MPRKVNPEELQEIVAILSFAAAEMTLEEIRRALGVPPGRRTLQRRLLRLITAGAVTKSGKGRSTRYESATVSRAVSQEGGSVADEDVGGGATSALVTEGPELSAEGKEILVEMRRPLSRRAPVGYRRQFLDDYVANRSFYLRASIRDHLEGLGRVKGEIQPAGTYARRVLDRLLIDLSFNSSRLEGNTYSMLETKRLIELGRVARGRDAEETQMVVNHRAAIEFLVESVGEKEIGRRVVLNLHALLSENLIGDPASGGRLRRAPVAIGGSSYVPVAVPQVVEECFNQILAVASRIEHPFEQAFFLLVQLPYLQPFDDVNKRLSRLCANIPLVRENLRPLSFIDVPRDEYLAGLMGVYELNRIDLLRDVFVWAYERSAKRYAVIRDSLGKPDEFRLNYRSEIKEAVGRVIVELVAPADVVPRVERWAESRVPMDDRARFVATVEAELVGLHDGNYARFPVTPDQYEAWAAIDA